MANLNRLRNKQGFWTLIGILLAAAIIVVLVVVMFGPNSKIGPEGRLKQASEESGLDVQTQPGQSMVGAVRDTGKEPVCRNNLQQIRAYLTIEQTQNDQYPATLEDRKIGSGSILNCPVSNQPYSYDPGSGRVQCTTPGHEGF
jgi:hypothetical protein